ncbi:MAG: ADP-ribosylglycohydrolase family protein [Actinobacteria bacterium]|nr:ADP-ribosylglycohydrolase family protein [Actinomycetota bacterium]MBU1944852.1 ADP-ribosylglycohydrolase family protein [Actinomycetota bacterium]MBU2687081.1 ADP-ribosylglycohydrolase family protein [Actinomycetota bacterium]
MIGAIAGDIIGSPYEGMRNNIRTCEFPLFVARSRFTDDTVLTVAVAEAVMRGAEYAGKLKEYYHLYPHAGYGGMFIQWANSASSRPYNSFGNGSAMRVSPVAYACGTLEEVLDEAAGSAAVTHDHPEGIKGAQAAAAAAFLARTGESKDYIREYTEESFGYDLSEPIDSLRDWYAREFDPIYVTCQGSVPQAIRAFLDSEGFEDAVRKAVSIGGDSDTIACIAGGIAQAYYGVPRKIEDQVMARLDERLSMMTLEFMEKYLR